jgi:hypothetical protein
MRRRGGGAAESASKRGGGGRGLEILSGRVTREVVRLRERLGLSQRFGKVAREAPPVIASLERIATLRASGALSGEEYERLRQVLLEGAGRGTAPAVPAFYTSNGG